MNCVAPVLILAGTCFAATISNATLLGYWNFDDGTGTTALDTSGNGHHGTLGFAGAGAVPNWDNSAPFGTALDFNDPGTGVGQATSGSLVTVPFDAAFRLNDSFTISYWWRPDVDYTGGFPGAMRIGSQSATTGTNIGWGFWHSAPEVPFFKRGNVQPSITNPGVGMTVGEWHHLLISHDATTGQNLAVQDGQFRTFTQAWLDATSSANLEFGRMDAFANAGLDDIAIFDNTVTLGQARSLYTVYSDLGLAYSLAEIQQLWNIHASGPGGSGVVNGTTWQYTATLPGGPSEGDSYTSGANRFVALASGTGVYAAVPEASSLSLMALGMGLVGFWRRRLKD